MPLRFKIADTEAEFEQIHRLNHRTFAGEIPQHLPRADRRLIDRFHEENRYAIAVRADGAGTPRVIGMLALRGRRPFSLDRKLTDLDARLADLPAHRRPCEIRLLAVEPAERGGAVFRGLAETLLGTAMAEGYDLALISGTPRQARLYAHLGFRPFGPRVGDEAALYQPMFLTPRALRTGGRAFRVPLPDVGEKDESERSDLNMLPGPTPLSPLVRAALGGPELSHRDPEFRALFERLRTGLCTLAGLRRGGAADVQVLSGTGTAANDMIAGQLSLRPGPGVVFANGEFGERLIDHARRWRLDFREVRRPWGSALDEEGIAADLRDTGARWLWAVHGETSTGGLNPLPRLKELACLAGGDRFVG
ncbi:MAG: aminotransferase V, partial [Planctomycetota bacterium]